MSHQEAEKTVQSAKKVADSQALKAAKAQGKDVYEAEKAQIAWEKVIAAELKVISAESLWEWNMLLLVISPSFHAFRSL